MKGHTISKRTRRDRHPPKYIPADQHECLFILSAWRGGGCEPGGPRKFRAAVARLLRKRGIKP